MRLKKKVALAEHSTALVCVLLSVESLGLLEACYLYLLNRLARFTRLLFRLVQPSFNFQPALNEQDRP